MLRLFETGWRDLHSHDLIVDKDKMACINATNSSSSAGPEKSFSYTVSKGKKTLPVVCVAPHYRWTKMLPSNRVEPVEARI
jgi:hypothetical protein